jgi:signal recognition particle subunit SRP54
MMSSLATGSMPGVPGIAGLTGPRRQPTRSQKKKGGRGVSGNPAKRNAAQQPAAAVDPAAAFGGGEFDQAALEKAMADFQLPPELRSRFGK